MPAPLSHDPELIDPELIDPVLVEVRRGGIVESRHRARIVVTAPGGSVEGAIADVSSPMYPRSSAKPMQAVAMLRSGLSLPPNLLALAAASHSGEEFHREGARAILAGVGLGVEALRNIADYPLDEAAKVEWIAAGRGKEPVAMNCSGKHAAMLATCVAAGWELETYLDPAHPLQQEIGRTQAEFSGAHLAPPTGDGCGAPLFAMPLAGLAAAFGRIAAATQGPDKQLADAYRAHPEWASGTRRDEAALHRAIPGLVGKAGADAVYAVGLPDGRGVAIKISDGSARARAVLMATVLQVLGYDHETLTRQASEPVLGHGEPVGEIVARREVLESLLAA